jgi:hypothetical protein
MTPVIFSAAMKRRKSSELNVNQQDLDEMTRKQMQEAGLSEEEINDFFNENSDGADELENCSYCGQYPEDCECDEE